MSSSTGSKFIVNPQRMRKDVWDWVVEKLGQSNEKQRVRVRLLELRLQQAVIRVAETLKTRVDVPRTYWKAARTILRDMMVRRS